MRRQAVINRESGSTTGSSLWRIVMPHSAKASAAETISVPVGLNGALIPSALRLMVPRAALAFAAVAVPAEDVRGHLSGRTGPTNATPNLARFQQRPHRDPQW
jgi:hypothetical protein